MPKNWRKSWESVKIERLLKIVYFHDFLKYVYCCFCSNYDIQKNKLRKQEKPRPMFLFRMYFASNIHFASNKTHFLYILYPTKHFEKEYHDKQMKNRPIRKKQNKATVRSLLHTQKKTLKNYWQTCGEPVALKTLLGESKRQSKCKKQSGSNSKY